MLYRNGYLYFRCAIFILYKGRYLYLYCAILALCKKRYVETTTYIFVALLLYYIKAAIYIFVARLLHYMEGAAWRPLFILLLRDFTLRRGHCLYFCCAILALRGGRYVETTVYIFIA